MISAHTLAPLVLVSPFRYTRQVFALLLGVLVLGERPDRRMLLGASIVVAAGTFSVWRERQKIRQVR